jgi:DNA polymerase III epsilon subunit-like protein
MALKALVLDTETTGLISSGMVKAEQLPEIIEFYAAMIDFKKTGKYKLLEELELLIKPDRMIQEHKTGRHNITKITGITNAMVQDAPAFSTVANKVFPLIERAPVIISHNIAYDMEVLDIEAKRLGYQIKWPQTICTVEATAYLKGDRLKLVELHELLLKEKFVAHRARQDVEALIRCCAVLYKQGII